MSKRSYQQNCALALGLDIIGERWTLLIIRALLTGPKRYSDLADQLPTMGTNLLAMRLKSLKEYGVVDQVNETGSKISRYSLTENGEQLRPIIHSLIRWGHQFRDRVGKAAISRPEWDMLAIEAAFRPERAENIDAVIDLTLDGFRFHIVIRDQTARCVTGAADEPDVIATTHTPLLMKMGEGNFSINEAISNGDLEITGSRRAFSLLFKLFEL